MVNGGGPISIQRPQDIREYHKSCVPKDTVRHRLCWRWTRGRIRETWELLPLESFASDVVVKKKRQCFFFFFFFFGQRSCHITISKYRGQCYAYLRKQRDLADGVFDELLLPDITVHTGCRNRKINYTTLNYKGHVDNYYGTARPIVLITRSWIIMIASLPPSEHDLMQVFFVNLQVLLSFSRT